MSKLMTHGVPLVGIIGQQGRMGQALHQVLTINTQWQQGKGYDKNTSWPLDVVFRENQGIIDVSSADLTEKTVQVAKTFPRPVVVCVTGEGVHKTWEPLGREMPIMLAPNTSFGAFIQRFFAAVLERSLGGAYDVDIFEAHHNQKQDAPSGTAKALAAALHPRVVPIVSQRRGALPGEHNITFTNSDEELSLGHRAFGRRLFAQGALDLLTWLMAQPAGVYTPEHAYGERMSQAWQHTLCNFKGKT